MTRSLALAIAAMGAVMPACGLSQQGVTPPDGTIAFPASAVVDPSRRWMFVANSNADLRYNDGTVVTMDLDRARTDRENPVNGPWPPCADANYKDPNPLSDPAPYPCCRDRLDPNVINCDERRYIRNADRSVRIGSFAAGMLWQKASAISNPDCGPAAVGLGAGIDRLLVAVRGDTSLTWINVTLSGDDQHDPYVDPPQLDCGGSEDHFKSCDDWHRVITAENNPDVSLPDEPYALALDPGVGLVYVAHLSGDVNHRGTGGISLFDVAATGVNDRPRFLGPSGPIFSANSGGFFGVTSLTPRQDGSSFDLYATSRYVPQTLGLRTTLFCPITDGVSYANLVLLGAGGSFNPSVGGTEIRGIQFPATKPGQGPSASTEQQAFVLQRNPPLLVGFTGGTPTSFLETCSSPTFLYRHNAGHAGERLFVNCSADGEIWVFDPTVPRLVTTFSVGRSPAGLVFEPTDQDEGAAGEQFGTTVYVVGFGDNNISVVDLTPGGDTEYHVVQRLGFPRISPR
jgi:hypothetical protein